jgi:hypothetical protein
MSGRHHTPHLQVIYNELNVQIDLMNFKILKGNLPPQNYKKAIEWVKDNQSWLLSVFNELNDCLFEVAI